MKKTTKKITIMAVSALMLTVSIVTVSCAGFLDELKKELPMDLSIGQEKGLNERTIIDGLKEALSVSTENAVKTTSKTNGYFKNPEIKIPIPPKIEKVGETLRKAGFNKQVDEFILSMNRAAEKAAPKAASIFVDAIKRMSFDDARGILDGGDTAATEYFQRKSSVKIADEFRPVITEAMDSVGATKNFKKIMDIYKKIPFTESKSIDLDEYVTELATNGLFLMLGNEEKKIRKDPAARVTELLKKVFGGK
ncbi:MAG: DUF4197 domain-containing protein [Deltaproteobacteria bacterium]|nr:DUF4197 domain-containing protein [Deltaproteobacteria bacterium]